MRFLVISALAAALIAPVAATSDPASNPGASDVQTAAGSAGAQPQPGTEGPGVTQAPAAASAPSATTAAQTPPTTSQAAGAARQTGPETVVVRGDAVDLDQIVCKEAPPKIGSRIGGGRECLSQREWNRRMRESQDITRRQQRMGYHGS